MEVITIQKRINSTPRKLRLVADMVRGLSPFRAIETLRFTNKKAALPLSKAIKTVLANAKQQNLDTEKLIFKKLEINEDMMLKRMRPQARGRRNMYTKKTSQIRIVLTDEIKNIEETNKGGKINGTKN